MYICYNFLDLIFIEEDLTMTTLFMHHYYVPKKAQGHVCKTDAHLQFDNADHIGREAILETYDRLFNLWAEFTFLYLDLYEKADRYIRSRSPKNIRKNWQILE